MKKTITGLIPVMYALIALLALPQFAGAAMAAEGEGETAEELSLMTETPAQGFALAITLARRAVTETQQDTEVLHALRPGYAHNAGTLIATSQVVAIHFQTVAAANNYWRD